MPFIQFSYPTDGHPVGEPVHLGEDQADAYVRDGVAARVDPPKPKTPKVSPRTRPEPNAPKPKAPAAKKPTGE